MTSLNKIGRNARDIADQGTAGDLPAWPSKSAVAHGAFSAQTMMMSAP